MAIQSMPYRVLKYYAYTPIQDPAAFREAQHRCCLDLGLLGRIKVASEGINGTLSGLAKGCQAYMQALKSDPRFADLLFNITPVAAPVHHKLHVRLKKEIVHSGLPTLQPSRDPQGRCYVKPQAFERMCQRKDVVVVDFRSNYEHRLGKFRGAVTLDIQNFRAFPAKIKALNLDKSKTYITVCTRGIKSEKGREYLKKVLGLPKVLQLEGGILDYGQATQGSAFEGSCYVFDQRLVVPINKANPTVISKCHGCQTPCARMVNCANPLCNRHLPICHDCTTKREGACSQACQCHPKKRPYNKEGYYPKSSNGYAPALGLRRAKQHRLRATPLA